MVRSRWLRNTIIVGIVLASFASALAIAYELALARVPRHRAALESLVRAQTGLDIRFNELSLRWGWYGPEAVFRRVELGEPGRSNVLLRAPQLIVAINAWQSVRSGALAAGRITIIAPDIDLERLTRQPPQANVPAPSRPRASGGRARVLERWKGGVIDLQGGTLRVPDPAETGSALTLQIRRAALKKDGQEWSGHALVFLPERLGRTARVVAQLTGDIASLATLSGGLKFEGSRLAFSSWRGVLSQLPEVARGIPLGGSGDVTVDLTLKSGRVQKAVGQLRAADLAIAAPSWLGSARDTRAIALNLDYVTGEWRYLRRGTGSQLQVEQLVLNREQKDSPLPAFTVEMNGGHIHSTIERAPLSSLTAVVQWIAPELAPEAVALEGEVEDIEVDWNPARPEGFRLAASARIEEMLATSVTHGFALKSVPTRLQANENRVGVEIDAPTALLKLAGDPDWPTAGMKLVSRLSISRLGEGWQVVIPQLRFEDEFTLGELSGTVSGETPDEAPVLDLRGTVARADVLRVQQLFADEMVHWLGTGRQLAGGRIENGAFELRPARFAGAFNLRDARMPSDGAWPETQDLDARIEWNGSTVRATVEEGRAGAFMLDSVEAQWDGEGRRPSRFTGRAHGKLEEALAWVRENPDVQQYAPHVQDLVARGEAVVDFDVTVPPSSAAPRSSASGTTARTRISTVLEGVQLTIAPGLPPVESLRGALAYEAGRLQRSTLSATWLGGPLTLRIAERRDRRGPSLAVQAQGFVDARKLVALSQIRHLAEVNGETAWSGEFVYVPPTNDAPARWQGRADSTLVGITSALPAPLAKAVNATLPLHVELTGSEDESELRANLADRVRTAFALKVVNGQEWRIARGAIRLGAGAPVLPGSEVVQVRGHVKRLDAPAYMLAWQQLREGSPSVRADIDVSADELVFGDRVYSDGSVQAKAGQPGMPLDSVALRIEAPILGVLTGSLMPDVRSLAFVDLHLVNDSLTGAGNLRCAADLATCSSEFEVTTTDASAALTALGFRPDLSASEGGLSAEIAWQPRGERPWLESVSGTMSMRFEEGVARQSQDTEGRPFPLLTVPALLGGISRAPVASAAVAAQPGSQSGSQPGDLRFTRMQGRFQLRDGYATTSDLHFDGDAEILVRGRTGLVTRDYDHQAWILRGEDRIPTSVRRLASAPRVAAAWLTLRELIGGDDSDRSRIVLHLHGPWAEPVVELQQE